MYPTWVKTLSALRLCIVLCSIISLALLLGKVYYKVLDFNGHTRDICFVGLKHPKPSKISDNPNNGIAAPRTNVRHRDQIYTDSPYLATDYYQRQPYPTKNYWNHWPYPSTDYWRQRTYRPTDDYWHSRPYPTTNYWNHWPYPTRDYWQDRTYPPTGDYWQRQTHPTKKWYRWPYPTTNYRNRWPYPTTDYWQDRTNPPTGNYWQRQTYPTKKWNRWPYPTTDYWQDRTYPPTGDYWQRRPHSTTSSWNRWPYPTTTHRQHGTADYRNHRPDRTTDYSQNRTYRPTDYWHLGDYPNTAYLSDWWSQRPSQKSFDIGLLGFPTIEAEVCEVALASYSLSILVAVIFLAVDVLTMQNPHLHLGLNRAMRYSDIATATMTALLVSGSLSYYVYGFSESLKSIPYVNQDPPGAETAAALMIIVFNVAALISWGCICLVLVRRLRLRHLSPTQPDQYHMVSQDFLLTTAPQQLPYISLPVAVPSAAGGNNPGTTNCNRFNDTASQQNQAIINV